MGEEMTVDKVCVMRSDETKKKVKEKHALENIAVLRIKCITIVLKIMIQLTVHLILHIFLMLLLLLYPGNPDWVLYFNIIRKTST